MKITDRMVTSGGIVKATGEGVIEGYLMRFTNRADKDKHGEYFDKRTDFGFEKGYAITNAFNLYHHGVGELGATKIGRFVDFTVDDYGVKATAQLDMSNPAVPPLYAKTQRGELHWSSGALPQSVKVAPDGHIERWYAIEGSLTPDPAEPDGTQVRAIKAAQLDDAIDPTGEGEPMSAANDGMLETSKGDDGMDILNVVTAVIRKLGAEMSAEDIASLIDDIRAAAGGEVAEIEAVEPEAMMMDDPASPLVKSVEKITDLVTTRVNAVKSAKAAQLLVDKVGTGKMSAKNQLNNAAGAFDANPVGTGGANPNKGVPAIVHQARVKSRISNISPENLAYALMVDHNLSQMGNGVARVKFDDDGSEIARNVAKGIFAAHAIEAADKGNYHLGGNYSKAFTLRENVTKSNELDNTQAAGFGAEWVPDSWSQQLWFRARRENVVMSKIPSFTMQTSVQTDPTESSDGTVYLTTEQTDATSFTNPVDNSSRIGTDNEVFNVTNKILQRQVLYSYEQIEEGLGFVEGQFEAQARRNMLDAFDDVILNGDTDTGTTNINNDGTALAASDRRLIFNGLIDYALANAATNMSSAAPTYDKIVEMLYDLNSQVVGNTQDTVLFVQPAVNGRLIRIDEYVTADKVGGRGANVTGAVPQIAGVDVLLSQQIYPSATNGKVNDTSGDNLYGRMVAVYLPYWKLGIYRNITSYMARSASGRSYMLTLTARMDLKQHTDLGGASLLYNILV